MVAQRVLVLLAKVRFLLGRQVKKPLNGVIGSIPDFRSGGGGSNPSGVYMEFVWKNQHFSIFWYFNATNAIFYSLSLPL